MGSVIAESLCSKATREMPQVIGVGAHRARRQLTKMLGIEKIVDPGDLAVLLSEQAIRTGAGLGGGLMRRDQPHNCYARSRQPVKRALVPRALLSSGKVAIMWRSRCLRRVWGSRGKVGE